MKDVMLRRAMDEQLRTLAPQVQEVKGVQDEIAALQRQLDVLAGGQTPNVTLVLKELTEIIPADAYLTSVNVRGGKITLDGQANQASGLISALEKSKLFEKVTFASPTTRTGEKERFSIVAEVER
jgi:general secretion pathway protein L